MPDEAFEPSWAGARPMSAAESAPPAGRPASRGAVFISYASQDAEAVRGIAEALRDGGVEVWFDRSELRGGDAWDQKIRRQIRDCTLFVPVISANTQARGEGYFRREWKLAVERTMDMADGVPFLFPVVLDGVPDRDALVPDVFRHVQWTHAGVAGLPPAFVTNVRALLEGTMAAPASSDVSPNPRTAGRGRTPVDGRSPRNHAWVGIVAICGGLLFGAYAIWEKSNRRQPPPVSPSQAVAAPAQPSSAPTAVPAPALDPRRVALARFENLTGDPAFDNVARLLESELTRGLGTLPSIRLLPTEASGRAAARAAAREAGAASVIVGAYSKQDDQIEIGAEIVLVTEGEVFGTVGPAMASAANLRGPALTDFVDRLATGAHNVAVTLQNPPTRMAAVTYNRPWPRWSVVNRAQGIRAMGNTPEEVAKAVQQYRDVLAEAPEMLKIKHDLARLLMNSGRFDEAQQLFRELLGPDRSRLSESEVLAITYDDALLLGDPDRAMTAARGLMEIRPMSDAITQVLSCLWAQNRPRAAFVEFDRWWKKHGTHVPEASRFGTETGLVATEALMHVQEDNPEQALAVIARGEAASAGRPFPAAYWLRGAAFSALGREADQQRLVMEAGTQTGSGRVEPLSLQWQGFILALHHGRAEEATRWLAAAVQSWDNLPAVRREDGQFQTLGVWLNEAAGRHAEAMQALDSIVARYPDLPNVVGARAVLLTAMGRLDEAQPFVKRLEEWDLRNARGVPLYWRARLAARGGDKARAVELLRQAVASGLWFGGFQSPTFDYGRSETEFATLRGYPPYEQLLKPKG